MEKELWEEQYDRMIRWYEKMIVVDPEKLSLDEQNDTIYACFQNIFAMKDWLANSTSMSKISRRNISKAFEKDGDTYLGVVRDVCNGSKHFKLKKNRSTRKDPLLLTQVEYNPFTNEVKPSSRIIMAPNVNDTVQGVALYAINFWNKVLNKPEKVK